MTEKKSTETLEVGALTTNPMNVEYPRYQSKYLYLQAAGSDGSDGSCEGIHLRWTFRDQLQEQHLPKGDMAATIGSPYHTTIAFNKNRDFVSIYRTEYQSIQGLQVNFLSKPNAISQSQQKRRWEYIVEVENIGNVSVFLSFLDWQQYDKLSASIDPSAFTQEFMQFYKGVIQVQIPDRLMFAVEFKVSDLPTGCRNILAKNAFEPKKILFEAITKQHSSPDSSLTISCRKTMDQFSGGTAREMAENIFFFRFQAIDCLVKGLKLEFYEDCINNNLWTSLGEFALPENTNEALTRLEDTPNYTIDNSWPHYNGSTKVRSSNYVHKWNSPEKSETGIKEAVKKYLLLSRENVYAWEVLPSQIETDETSVTVSYIQLLNLIANDYHIARMLGLGHIDMAFEGENPANKQYVYLARYESKKGTLGAGDHSIFHSYMSLPTSKLEQRLPEVPMTRPVKYKLNMESEEGKKLCDEKGYSHYFDVRFINIGREPYDYEKYSQPASIDKFYETANEFSISQISPAVMYGIAYKKEDAPKYVKPEITSANIDASHEPVYYAHDDDFPDQGIVETVPVLDNEQSLFVHQEREGGKHVYALYGINWFSRPSPLGNKVETDITKFPKRKTMLPPSNLSVQYIQEEDPLVFTSQNEQAMLIEREAANPGGDNYFTRITFNYDHNNNIAYGDAKKIYLYHRSSPPLGVKGSIQKVSDLGTDENHTWVDSESYEVPDPENLVTPYIAPGDENKFVGSTLVTFNPNTGDEPYKHYIVKEIQQGVDGPRIKIEKAKRSVVGLGTDVDKETNEAYDTYFNSSEEITPVPGETFVLTENLANDAQWNKLSKEVEIIHHSDYTESLFDDNDDETILSIGGIIGQALVEKSGLEEIDGLYRIVFLNTHLEDHPDITVSWYRGIARLNCVHPMEKAVLDVWKIEQQHPLVIWARQSGETSTAIATGKQQVNFHPGYRVYLDPEPNIGFTKTNLLPEKSHTQTSFIGAQSVDIIDELDLRSSISIPATLLAQKINPPLAPGKPLGKTFATRPNYYGKSTYTFDVEVNTEGRKPFGFIFYRANELAILNALYRPETLTLIYQDLADLDPDEYHVNRFADLVNVVLEEGQFKEYQEYRFPFPDKEGFSPDESEEHKKWQIKKAIESVFVPLTENPPIFDHIQIGRQTERIEPNDINPFPMLRTFIAEVGEDEKNGLTAGKTYVRFTDYALDGASIHEYFYCAVEISNRFSYSERSGIQGPICLVNTLPAEAPIIKKVTHYPSDPAIPTQTSVMFNIEPYLESEGITAIRIYRALNRQQTTSVQTMELAAECLIDQIFDSFCDLPLPPYGELIYYRLVALRKIINEFNEVELVPSKPSDVFMTNIIDEKNPEAPVIDFTYNEWIENPKKLSLVSLQWESTCYKGIYRLFKQNHKGNWQLLETYTGTANSFIYPASGAIDELVKEDKEGREIFHHYKVEVENASGLTNLESNPLTI